MNGLDEAAPDSSESYETLTDSRFRRNFEQMLYSGEMCDVTIGVQGSQFKAHKLILAGCSPYFKCMFGQKKFSESEMDKVPIDPEGTLGIKARAMEQLIHYMYTGCLDLSQGNIIDLIWASDLLQLPDIKEQSLDKLEEMIDFSTYLDICEVGTVFSRPKLIHAVDRFIRANFDDFIGTPAFYELSLADLTSYLSHRNLKTSNEESVFSAALRWCKHNKSWENFAKLANVIRFDLISVKYLCSILREDADIKSNAQVQDLILSKIQEMKKPLTISKPRISLHMLVAMPYRSKTYFIITFHSHDSIDVTVKEFPDIISEQINSLINYSICSLDGSYIYLAGGTSYNADNEAYHSDQGFLYDIASDKWSIGPCLPSRAYGFGIASLDQKLYFVPNDDGPGGATCTKMFDLDSPNDGWVIVGHMNYRRSQVYLVTDNDLLYAIGGMENGGYTSTVEVFDPIQQIWSEIDSMSQARCNPGVACANGKIFVIGGLGDNLLGPPGALKTAEFYDPNTDSWTLLPDMYFARHSPAVAFKNNKLYVFGGGSPAPLLRPGPERTIEVFDFDKHEWFVFPEKIPGRANAIYVSAFFDDLEMD